MAGVNLSRPLSGNNQFAYFVCLLMDSLYQDIHCAGQGQGKNFVKQSYQVFLVGEGGREEAVEGEAAGVGDHHGEEAGNPSLHPCLCFFVYNVISGSLSLLFRLGEKIDFLSDIAQISETPLMMSSL